MSDNKTTVRSGGIGFTGVLTIVFIVLKLIGIIEWSWVWVLSPLWIGFILGVILLVILIPILVWLDK
jgi:hypothetical protein